MDVLLVNSRYIGGSRLVGMMGSCTLETSLPVGMGLRAWTAVAWARVFSQMAGSFF